jgi:hypothetical protein
MPMILKRSKYFTTAPADFGLEGPAADLAEQHRVSLEAHAEKALELLGDVTSNADFSPAGKSKKMADLAQAAIKDVDAFTATMQKSLKAQLAAAEQQLPRGLPSLLDAVKGRNADLWNSLSGTAASDATLLRRTMLFGDLARSFADDLREIRVMLRALDPAEVEGMVLAAAHGTDARSLDLLLAVSNDPGVRPLVAPEKMQEAASCWLQATYPEPFAAAADVRTAIKLVNENTTTVLREIQREAGMPLMGQLKDTIALQAHPIAAAV